MFARPAQMDSPASPRPARWLVVLLLAGVAGALLTELVRTSRAAAQGSGGPIGSGRGLVAVPAQISRDSYGLYLVDADHGRLCVYQYQPGNRKLRLLAVRNFTYDLGLEDYNTLPSPREVKDVVQQIGSTGPVEFERPGGTAGPEPASLPRAEPNGAPAQE